MYIYDKFFFWCIFNILEAARLASSCLFTCLNFDVLFSPEVQMIEGYIYLQVIDYYSKKSVVAHLHADNPPQEVTAEVQKVLSS